ncbi:kinase-like domain-containing protein [Rhizophagus irregularis DAOM 181602=DAOM 197198]|nr:kinase-like domain-containing protein [Rhizophagus irregularis DAOM 181602=DAOM 197198]
MLSEPKIEGRLEEKPETGLNELPELTQEEKGKTSQLSKYHKFYGITCDGNKWYSVTEWAEAAATFTSPEFKRNEYLERKLCGYCKIDQSCARKYRKSFSENSTIPEKFKYLSLNAVNHDPESRLKVTTIFEVLLNLLKDLHTHIRLQIHFINC